jgi:3-phenylpropionate/trans-cinnamate dioxygenase ferredoxin subunit
MQEMQQSPAGSSPTLFWTFVMDDSALAEGEMAPVYPRGMNVVIARVGGTVYAVAGKCAHMACPLFTGVLDGYTLTCACHDWRFDIRTGRFINAPELGIAVYPTKTEDGKLYVSVGE